MPRPAPACERVPVLLSVSTPVCACTHRRTAVRVPSPHVAASTLAAAPPMAQRRGVLGIVRSTPSSARALRVAVASAAHIPVPLPRADRSTHGPMSTPRVPSEYPASSNKDGPCSDYRSSTVSEAPGAARARTTPQRTQLPYGRESPPSTLRALLREGVVPHRRRRAVRAVVRAYSLSALRAAVCASTAHVPLPPPCAYPRSTGRCV